MNTEPAVTAAGWDGFVTFLLAGVLVALLAYGASRLLARWQLTKFNGRRMRVLEAMPIGKDRYLLLVAVGKELLILGSSEGGVQVVHQLPEDSVAEILASADQPTPKRGPDLAAWEESVRGSLVRMRGLLARSRQVSHGEPPHE